MARGHGMKYGARSCERCGRAFEAHSSTHKYCETCAAVHQAMRMRNRPAQCDGCGNYYHRRDGRDLFCPACHALGFGEKRWHPGPVMEQPCGVCGKRGPSVAPELDVCSACLASPERGKARKVSRKLGDYVRAVQSRQDEKSKVVALPTEDLTKLRAILAEHPDSDVVMRTVYERSGAEQPYELWLRDRWWFKRRTGDEYAQGKFSTWLPVEAKRHDMESVEAA